MRILIDALALREAGIDSLGAFIHVLTDELARQNPHDQFFVIANHPTAPLFASVRRTNVRIIRVFCPDRLPLARILYQQVGLPVIALMRRCDALICPADVSPVISPIPVILKVNSFQHHHAPASLGRVRTLYRNLFIAPSARRAAFVMANSRSTACELRRLAGVPEARIRIAYEAVLGAFADESVNSSLAETLPAPFILFVSALYAYKRHDLAIETLASLVRERGWDGHLVCIGPDADSRLNGLRAHADRCGVGDRVRFLGRIDNRDLPAIYRRAELLLYPSDSETFGKPPVEAMTVGTPVVASARGSIPEVVGEGGLIVAEQDVAAYANAVWRVLTDRPFRDDLIRAGLERARTFSYSTTARLFHEAVVDAVAIRGNARRARV
jgi:alpha-1,3-rhamnosyl/mannosyltransferase